MSRTSVAARIEDLQWMADTGESLTGAAHRLAISTDALEKFCERHHVTHLARRLRARDIRIRSAA